MRLLFATFLLTAHAACAADPKESDYYPIQPLPNPSGFVLETGALTYTPDGRVFAATRRGEVFEIKGALGPDLSTVRITRYAAGMHECLGLAWKDDSLYVAEPKGRAIQHREAGRYLSGRRHPKCREPKHRGNDDRQSDYAKRDGFSRQ